MFEVRQSGAAIVGDGTNGGDATRLLEQPMRRKILQIIREEPGIKISDLCRRTGAGWGTVKYHLHLLKRAHFIVSRSTGRDCLLFASDFPVEQLAITEALRRGRAESLAVAIAQRPGATQKELCERVHMTRKIIRRYVDLLSAAGLINERREAQFQRYYPGPLLPALLRARPEAGPAGAPSPTAGSAPSSMAPPDSTRP